MWAEWSTEQRPTELWLGFIVGRIHCGLDQLWLGSNLTSLRPGGQVANARGRCAPRACKNLLHPTPLWLGFIVVWINYGLAQILIVLVSLSLFNWVWFSKTYVQYETS